MTQNDGVNKHYLEHRKRLRERFMTSGIENLQDYEIIEMLLTFSIPYIDVKPIAKILFKEFGSIKGVMDASPDDLKSIPYVKDKTIELISFIKTLSALYQKEKAKEFPISLSTNHFIDYFKQKIGNNTHEELHVVYLNSKYSIIDSNTRFPAKDFYFQGTIDRAVVYPRKIMELALKLKAYAFIIAHNHTNGIAQPSEYDITFTKALDLAAKSLGLQLYDHIIITSGHYFSFKENKMI